MKYIKRIVLILLSAAIFYQFTALLKCEILTIQHGNEFRNLLKQDDTMSAHNKNMKIKVLNYYRNSKVPIIATVYYWSPDTFGEVCIFKSNYATNSWDLITYDTIWSKSGSASETIWPYWWHFIYGGF